MPAPAAPGIASLAGTAAGITVALSVATAIVFAAQIRTVLESPGGTERAAEHQTLIIA